MTSSPEQDAARGAPPEAESVEPVPETLWRRVHQDPLRAPEHIALAAADRFAGPAERWVQGARHRHPPHELGAIAVRRHVRLSRLEGAAAGLGGAFTAVPDLAALAWIQGSLVFYVAAAHGFDPRHPMRPAELLALQGMYPTPAEARAALDGVGQPLTLRYIDSYLNRERQLVRRLVKLVGRKVAKRYALRIIPFVSAPISSVQNARATGELGRRALAFYGGGPAGPPPAALPAT